ncbi:MAG: NAD-dependent epimerase/dehydratase family protein [Gammaproteobacteria bacterium]
MSGTAPSLFLTGGAGFIGSQLAQLAVRAGHRVTVTTAVNNDVERARCSMLGQAGLLVIVAQLEDRHTLERAMRGSDAVIHLAAAQHEAHAPETHFRSVNVEGTRTLLRIAERVGIRRFVYGSTIGVYGSSAAGELDADSALAPDNPYGRTKAEAEAVVRQYASRVPSCIARISEVYGPGDLRLLKLFRAIESGRYVTIGRGTNEHQVIYVDDLVRGLLAAARSDRAVGETFVLAGSECLTTDEMASAIGAAVGQHRRPRHVPMLPFDLAARFFEASFPRFGLAPPLHRRRLDFFRKSLRFSTEKAARLLDFRAQVGFAEGTRRTAQWYRENGFLAGSRRPASDFRPEN